MILQSSGVINTGSAERTVTKHLLDNSCHANHTIKHSQAIITFPHWFSLNHQRYASLSLVSTKMREHLGIPSAVCALHFSALFPVAFIFSLPLKSSSVDTGEERLEIVTHLLHNSACVIHCL